MYYNLIKKYVNIIKKEDIIEFAKNKNIVLNNIELNTIYTAIKTRWQEIYTDGIKVIEEYKHKLTNITYQALKEIYSMYKNKYLK